ncbi:hypothetical protein AVEN_149655-1 [Araneus ventricosus]|uniref:Uncharacterized protein n=1 Tax=Araneus ventricosus TaxID=182803 RepID=A0A4Y2XEF3_ARAVE|nr:hypothetical protein AVEN_274197-1 [Araneus ventricosus]GBO46930.1 hypothetical protein AVEN_149655-1 [Araneus ventricosus]
MEQKRNLFFVWLFGKPITARRPYGLSLVTQSPSSFPTEGVRPPLPSRGLSSCFVPPRLNGKSTGKGGVRTPGGVLPTRSQENASFGMDCSI